jgi:hypothetical protein
MVLMKRLEACMYGIRILYTIPADVIEFPSSLDRFAAFGQLYEVLISSETLKIVLAPLSDSGGLSRQAL